MYTKALRAACFAPLLFLLPVVCAAQGSTAEEDLAKQLANPISSLISVPFQLNYDQDIGAMDSGDRYTLNVQPVIPISLNEDWNLISRTILPFIYQNDVFPGTGSQSGTGDTVQSLFFSPVAPTAGGWIWGAGPVFLLPTGSDDRLTADKWAAGPTFVALKQQGPWTYGFLGNHLWSFAGEDSRQHVNSTFLQPFLSYNTPTAITFTAQTESTYNWRDDSWTVPLLVGVGKVTAIGKQRVQFFAGIRYYADSPASGPEGIGFRLNAVLLFPK